MSEVEVEVEVEAGIESRFVLLSLAKGGVEMYYR